MKNESKQGVSVDAPAIGMVGDQDELKATLKERQKALINLAANGDSVERGRALLDVAESHLGLTEHEHAWRLAKEGFDLFMAAESWQDAVEACDVLYQAQQPASIAALAHGVWLAVTYPVDPQVSYTLLEHIVDETPNDSDGAAVAAMTAHYLSDLRSSDEEHDSNIFLTRNLVARVAERHSGIQNQLGMDVWVEKLQLKEPQDFLPKLAQILDVIVEGQWWFDRDALRARLPVH
ncbi:MAG: hypothetical protein Q9N68_06140 [Gammaproteobacteria bacterium]|nr:hypothetical protein [Gammaproteobacteria bacterium]